MSSFNKKSKAGFSLVSACFILAKIFLFNEEGFSYKQIYNLCYHSVGSVGYRCVIASGDEPGNFAGVFYR